MKKVMFIMLLMVCCHGFVNASAVPFTDYGSGTTTEAVAGYTSWQLNFGQGPWTWFESQGDPILNAGVTGILNMQTTAPADINADLIATLHLAGSLTLTSWDEDNNPVGTMVLTVTGQNVIDINASRAIFDDDTGVGMVAFSPPEPKLSLTLVETTGEFAGITQADNWDMYLSGWYFAPIVEGLAPQDNIFAALGGQVPIIGGIMETTLTGQYVPEPATLSILFLGGMVLLGKRRL